MTPVPSLIAALALYGLIASGSAQAASSAVASASDSVSTSVESIGRSLRKSSNSSTRTVVMQGDYRVVQVAQVEPGQRDVTLQAVAGSGAEGEFTLRIGDHAADQGGLVIGQVVSARQRLYGVEFARADTRSAFLLLLDDDWYRELKTVPVQL
ncbi:MAG: hypothetical protein IPI03_22990 [Rubrivivax sp.]|nr:hypothetical protein [Rubrivivax sp.]MBK7264539.1 hypothetical protein [Rubrivivax sp.]MBK8530002.1 hypothetical protein [Rubrivivax sp.]